MFGSVDENKEQNRETKLVEYATGIQEYAIADRLTYRGQVLDEVLGYRLGERHYQPLTPDDEGRVVCDTVGLWLSLQNGCLVVEDAITGSKLQTSVELEALLTRYLQRFGELPDPNGGET